MQTQYSALICMSKWSGLEIQLCTTPTSGSAVSTHASVWECVCKLRPARAASRGPQWFRSSGIPRDVTPGWRYASLNRSYCNLFSVQRGFFWETASHCLHLFGKLKTLYRHAGDRACATAGLLSVNSGSSYFFFSLFSCNSLFCCSLQPVMVNMFYFLFFPSCSQLISQLQLKEIKCHVNLSALSFQFDVRALSYLLTVVEVERGVKCRCCCSVCQVAADKFAGIHL